MTSSPIEPAVDAPVRDDILSLLNRVTAALERIAPPPPADVDLYGYAGYTMSGDADRLSPVLAIEHVPLSALIGIDMQKAELLANLRGFASGKNANHVLLWGARGTGKSSLVKAAYMQVHDEFAGAVTESAGQRPQIRRLDRQLFSSPVCRQNGV